MEYYSAIKKNEIMPFAATCVSGSVVSDSATPQTVAHQAFMSMGFSRKGSHSLLQGIFPTWGSNPGLLHCRQILYHLSHQGTYINGTE